ncbi:hypothetical protein HA402_006082 [Bradysia odoriphaga]|nr:hypothetical protein HA402_006082 [Bradysia odoriphaga]
MSKLMGSFLEFVEANKTLFLNEIVNVSHLIDVSNDSTPIMLKYTDTQAAYANLPGKEFPVYGLIALRDIVTLNVNDENSQIALIAMVHLTKMQMPIKESASYYQHLTNIEIVKKPEVNTWLKLAYKVLSHKTIQHSINELLTQSFGKRYETRVSTTNFLPVSVKIVHTKEPDIRGFAGMNEIFINFGYFNVQKTHINCYELAESLKSNLLLIDIATCVIHEYAHVRARQVTNDLNHTTPEAILSTIEESDPEFGRMTERMFFGTHINWKKSFEQKFVSAEFIANFLEAIENNNHLPTFPKRDDVPARKGPKLMRCGGGGADIAYIQSKEIE